MNEKLLASITRITPLDVLKWASVLFIVLLQILVITALVIYLFFN